MGPVDAGDASADAGDASADAGDADVGEPLAAPNAPSALTVVASGSSTARLNWTDNAANELGFRIERRVDAGVFATLITLGSNQVTHDDLALAPNMSFTYRLLAYNDAGNSSYSNEAAFVSPPAAPTDLSAIARATAVDLAWDASAGAISYSVLRALDAGGSYAQVGATANASYSDTSVARNTRYNYAVRSVGAFGPGGQSIDVSALTLTCEFGGATPIETMSNDAFDPYAAVDPAGNGVAVFHRWNGAVYRVYANRFDRTMNRWGDAGQIDNASGQSAARPRIASDLWGNMFAVFTQSFGADQTIVANRFSADAGSWGSGVVISPHDGGAYWPRVAVDPAGNAVAAWVQGYVNPTVVWANWYSASSGVWSDAGVIGVGVFHNDYSPHDVAFDRAGNATVVWVVPDGGVYRVAARRFSVALVRWDDAGIISSLESAILESPRLGVDDAGNVIAAWTQIQQNGVVGTFTNRYAVSSSLWGTANRVSPECCHASNPGVAVDPSGDAVVTFFSFSGTRNEMWTIIYRASVDRFDDAGFIGAATGDGGSYAGGIASDGFGGFIAVWGQGEGGSAVDAWASQFVRQTGVWTVPMRLETNSGVVNTVRIASGENGTAVATWMQTYPDASQSVWSNVCR